MNDPLPSPLTRPASIPVLRRLLAANVLTLPEEESFERSVRRELPWQAWLDRGLLSIGVTLILSGLIYFFSHHWERLTDNDKLALASGLVVCTLMGATWVGLSRLAGKVLVLAASVLMGICVTLYFQIHLELDDKEAICTTWAILISSWVFLGRFMPLWIFWMALINFAVGLYWPLAPFLHDIDDWILFRYEVSSLVLLNGFALLVREVAWRWPREWFDRGWSARLLLAGLVVPAVMETTGEILHTWDTDSSSGTAFVSFLLYAVGTVGLGYYFSRRRYSLPALAIITLGACTVLTVLAVRVLDFDHVDRNAGIWLLGGIIVLAIFGAGVFFLRTQRLAHHQD